MEHGNEVNDACFPCVRRVELGGRLSANVLSSTVRRPVMYCLIKACVCIYIYIYVYVLP